MDQGHDLVPVLDPARRVRGLEAAVALVRTLDLANINPPVTRRIRGTGNRFWHQIFTFKKFKGDGQELRGTKPGSFKESRI